VGRPRACGSEPFRCIQSLSAVKPHHTPRYFARRWHVFVLHSMAPTCSCNRSRPVAPIRSVLRRMSCCRLGVSPDVRAWVMSSLGDSVEWVRRVVDQNLPSIRTAAWGSLGLGVMLVGATLPRTLLMCARISRGHDRLLMALLPRRPVIDVSLHGTAATFANGSCTVRVCHRPRVREWWRSASAQPSHDSSSWLTVRLAGIAVDPLGSMHLRALLARATIAPRLVLRVVHVDPDTGVLLGFLSVPTLREVQWGAIL
jgi:hypothetical protein